MNYQFEYIREVLETCFNTTAVPVAFLQSLNQRWDKVNVITGNIEDITTVVNNDSTLTNNPCVFLFTPQDYSYTLDYSGALKFIEYKAKIYLMINFDASWSTEEHEQNCLITAAKIIDQMKKGIKYNIEVSDEIRVKNHIKWGVIMRRFSESTNKSEIGLRLQNLFSGIEVDLTINYNKKIICNN